MNKQLLDASARPFIPSSITLSNSSTTEVPAAAIQPRVKSMLAVTTPTSACACCDKSQHVLGVPLKRCSRCRSVLYCTRECQVADWIRHKSSCKTDEATTKSAAARTPQSAKTTGSTSGPSADEASRQLIDLLSSLDLGAGLDGAKASKPDGQSQDGSRPPSSMNILGHDVPVVNLASTGLSHLASASPANAYLSSLPEREAMRQLIDAYRLRIEEEYTLAGETWGLYNGDDPMQTFGQFLSKAEKSKVMPDWWTRAKRAECKRMAKDKNGDCCIYYAVEKSDIQDMYNDSFMPMKLRVLAEKVYGKGVEMGWGGW